jgi:hypothetical protein
MTRHKRLSYLITKGKTPKNGFETSYPLAIKKNDKQGYSINFVMKEIIWTTKKKEIISSKKVVQLMLSFITINQSQTITSKLDL